MNPPGAASRDRPAIDQGDDRFLAVLAAALPGACRGEDRPDGEAHPWSGEPADQTGVGYQLIMRGGVLRGEATSPHPGGARTTVLAWNRLPWRADRWQAAGWHGAGNDHPQNDQAVRLSRRQDTVERLTRSARSHAARLEGGIGKAVMDYLAHLCESAPRESPRGRAFRLGSPGHRPGEGEELKFAQGAERLHLSQPALP